jgi:hypothetical protein
MVGVTGSIPVAPTIRIDDLDRMIEPGGGGKGPFASNLSDLKN